jgi:uncharacterized protein (TIGR02452 family)
MYTINMNRRDIAAETLAVIRTGSYQSTDGQLVDFSTALAAAKRGTALYTPTQSEAAVATVASTDGATTIEVTAETTCAAAQRLATTGVANVVALNFASAKNPGGGFLSGAKAQEEDLSLCSALYACQLKAPAYYAANRACDSLLYTDHIIYSPAVPFFRDDEFALLPAPYLCSVITAPAPNAGEYLRRSPGGAADINATLERRAAQVLAVAVAQHHRNIILGAWGCGVFRNAPALVAQVFANLLRGAYRGAFEHVVFAIYDRSREGAKPPPFVGNSPMQR